MSFSAVVVVVALESSTNGRVVNLWFFQNTHHSRAFQIVEKPDLTLILFTLPVSWIPIAPNNPHPRSS